VQLDLILRTILENYPVANLDSEVAKMKIAENYRQTRKTIVADNLSDILDGVLPKPLCDTVPSKVAGRQAVHHYPLLVEALSMGTLLLSLMVM